MEQRHLLNHELARTAGMLSGARRGAMMLVATLLFTLTAQTAWAQELLTSGKCGTNTDNAGVVWSFNETTKTLTISLEDGYTESGMNDYYPNYVYEDLGGGDYDENKPAPWRNYTDHEGNLNNGPGDLIEHIVVEEGVYRISENAFYGLANLKDVTLASTVNVLGEGAMQNDLNLTSVTLLCPAFISDYDYAFDDSDQLTIYVIKQQASNFEYNYSKIKVEGFLLTGPGYKATPNKDTRELLDVKRGNIGGLCTLTLKGDHTATINGKDYTIKSGTEITGPYYDGVIKEDTQEALDFDEVTETGKYRYKVQVEDVFADKAKENVVSDLFTVVSSPASGEGWAFNIEKSTLTISGNVTGEPWKPFADCIWNVIVEKDVTKMPEKAFTDKDAYEIDRIILRSTAVVDLNGAFSEKREVGDSEQGQNVVKDCLGYNIYVPSSILESYKTTYASLLEEADYDFFAFDISVTLPASGVMTFSADTRLDFTHSEGLKAYIASEFIPATGKVVMERVMTVCGYEGLVLKGTPNTTYSIEMAVDDSWVNNLLQYGYNAVDPADNPDYTYLQLDGTEFKEFTEATDLTGQAYLSLENDTYEGAKKPITMFFSDEDVMTSGVVKGDCYWSYDADTKTLTISGDETGTGSFAKEYDPANYAKPAPWRTWTTAEGVVVRKGVEDGIEHIVVENGVNYIGDYAFYGLKNLESVSLAPSVYSLYVGALQGCTKLKTVVCSYLSGIDMDTEDDTYSVANVGETYYVPNFKKVSFEEKLEAFDNVKVEGFYLSDGTLKVDFYEDPLEWDKDHYKGDISLRGNWDCWIEGAKATVNGTEYTYPNIKYVYNYTFRYRKDNQDPDLKWDEVTEVGNYYVKVTIEGYFADEAKNTAISEHYVELYEAPSSGDGWSYDRDHYVLTVSGNVTGEPWKLFKDDMDCVVVEEGVTKLPEKAFYNHYLDYAIIKGTGVDLNKAFLCTDEVYDELSGEDVIKDVLCNNIYVPAASVESYTTAYASYIVESGPNIFSSDVSIDITEASEGIRTYSDRVALDISACEGLHAYTITNFNTTTGALTLKSVTKLASIEGYLLMGNTGTYTAKVTVGVDWEKDNMLISTDYAEPEETEDDVTYVNLILAGSGEKRGFHPLSTGGYLPENVAVLQIEKEDFEAWKGSGAAPLHLEIDGADVTAISTMKVISTPADDAWYTLSGVRLEGKPAQKGVYIHQGKLIVIK